MTVPVAHNTFLIFNRKSTDEPHTKVNPDAYVDNLAQAVDQLLSKN